MSRTMSGGRPSMNFGKAFRVNFTCPNCSTHIRVPVQGYGRNGWNCRTFHCLKCKSSYTMHIATTVYDRPANPPVGTGTRKWLKDSRKAFKEDVDYLDLTFFNGHAFRPLFASFLIDLQRTLEGIRRKVPGFKLLFPEEDKMLELMIDTANQAAQNCRSQYDYDYREVWASKRW